MSNRETNVSIWEGSVASTLSVGATTITVDSTSGVPTVPFFVVANPSSDNREVILIDGSTTGTSLVMSSAALRGQDGTSDVEHAIGTVVGIYPVPSHWTDINDRVDAAVATADIDTLAELNAIVGDATLDTSSATRFPTNLSVTDAKVAAAAAIAQSKIAGLVDGLVNVAPFAKEGGLVVEAGAGRFRFPFAATVIDVSAAVDTPPTGASVIVDIDKATVAAPATWATIFTTQTNRPEIAVSTHTSALETPDVTSFAAGDYMRVNVDQIGSTEPGADLSVFVTYRRA